MTIVKRTLQGLAGAGDTILVATILLVTVAGGAPAKSHAHQAAPATPEDHTGSLSFSERSTAAANLFRRGKCLVRRGRPSEGLPHLRAAREAYAALEAKLGPKPNQLTPLRLRNLLLLGKTYEALGELPSAEECYAESLAILREQFPKERVKAAMNAIQLGHVAALLGRYDEATSLVEGALAVQRAAAQGEQDAADRPARYLTNSLRTAAKVKQYQAEYAQAIALMEEARVIADRLPDAADVRFRVHESLGSMLSEQGKPALGLEHHQRAAQEVDRLFPKSKYRLGHRRVADSLNNRAYCYYHLGDLDRALELYRESLQMKRALFPVEDFPEGHVAVARGLEKVAETMCAQGKLDEADVLYHEARDMFARLYPADSYPSGHYHLVRCLNGLGRLRLAKGELQAAHASYAEAARLGSALTREFADVMSEAESFNFASRLQTSTDGLLTARINVAAETYQHIWERKGLILRRKLRHQQAAAEQPLQETRAELARLTLMASQQNPSDRAAHRLRMKDVAARKEALERQMGVGSSSAGLGSFSQLLKVLPEDTAFIDVVKYRRFAGLPDRDGASTRHYTAFVLHSKKGVRRVEFGSADTIEQLVRLWRKNIHDATETDAGRRLADMIWSPLRQHLPASVRTLVICPESQLAFMPWCALPIENQRVLLHSFTVQFIPTGSLLLDSVPNAAFKCALAVGNVDFGEAHQRRDFRPLRGTRTELRMVTSAAQKSQLELTELQGHQATVDRIRFHLPQVEWAHVATHAYVRRTRVARIQTSSGFERVEVVQRNPLLRVGLACANANRRATAGSATILLGEAIAGLDLSGLDVAVLSACGTSLVDSVDGEGVFDLQRAFHAAGTRHTVAGIWAVPDQSAAKLMRRFYAEAWNKQQPVAVALRTAQLEMLDEPATSTRDWAGFVASGPK